MRFVILIFLFIQPFIGYSQFFIGDTKDFVVTILEKAKVPYSEAKITDTTHRISWIEKDDHQMIIVFNNKNIVTRQTLIPEGKNGLNRLVRWLNENFVVISDTEWKDYSEGRIYKIKLEYILTEPLFSITLSEGSN